MSPVVNHPDDFGRIFTEINRRLRALENSPSLSFSSIDAATGGALVVNDANSNPLAYFGSLPDGGVGVSVHSAAGGVVFESDTLGLVMPPFCTPFRQLLGFDTNGGIKVTSTSWVDVYTSTLEILEYDAVRVRVGAITTGTDQGQVRLKLVTNSAVTSPQTYTSSGGVLDWHWLHGGTPLLSGPWFLNVQAQQTVGTGGIWVWPPDGGATWYRGSQMVPPATNTGI